MHVRVHVGCLTWVVHAHATVFKFVLLTPPRRRKNHTPNWLFPNQSWISLKSFQTSQSLSHYLSAVRTSSALNSLYNLWYSYIALANLEIRFIDKSLESFTRRIEVIKNHKKSYFLLTGEPSKELEAEQTREIIAQLERLKFEKYVREVAKSLNSLQ